MENRHDIKHLPKIIIEVVPMSEMPIAGQPADWRYDSEGSLRIKVAPAKDIYTEIDTAFHEAFEAIECALDGVSVEEVDKYDEGKATGAGHDAEAPYNKQHLHALALMHLFFAMRGQDWTKYNEKMESDDWMELFE
ncbi:MAG TPA: hypothetical protein VF790_14010 [Dissulfurispiraceae bacterium]